MNKYESVIIIKPTLEKNERNEVMDKYQNIMKEYSGNDVKIEDLGMKKLAYQIQNQTHGYYVAFRFNAEPQNILELERRFRIDENVMKFMTVKEEFYEYNEEQEEDDEEEY